MASQSVCAPRPWADLPTDILEAVVRRLDIFNAAWLTAVCTSWAKAVITNPSLPFGMPCLLTSHEPNYYDDDDDRYDQCTFDLHKFCSTRHIGNTPVTANMEELRSRWWVGANGSWIVTVDDACNAELINPYTGEWIELPPVPNLSDVRWSHNIRRYAISRIVLCETPPPGANNNEAYLAIALLKNPSQYVAIARGTDPCWTVLKNSKLLWTTYDDAIMHKGKVFAVARGGDVYVWDIRVVDSGRLYEPELIQGPEVTRDPYPIPIGRCYLAETADGDRLLFACTYGSRCSYPDFCVEGMLLYELDIDATGNGWRRITSLGSSHSLFLGENYPFWASMQVNQTVPLWQQLARPNCYCRRKFRPNCVFIAITNTLSEDIDVVVYDLQQEKYTQVQMFNGDKYYSYQSPIWFRLTLQDCRQAIQDDLDGSDQSGIHTLVAEHSS